MPVIPVSYSFQFLPVIPANYSYQLFLPTAKGIQQLKASNSKIIQQLKASNSKRHPATKAYEELKHQNYFPKIQLDRLTLLSSQRPPTAKAYKKLNATWRPPTTKGIHSQSLSGAKGLLLFALFWLPQLCRIHLQM